MIDLKRILELYKQTSPGPWSDHPPTTFIFDNAGLEVADVYGENPERWKANLALILALHEGGMFLIKDVLELRAQLAEARELGKRAKDSEILSERKRKLLQEELDDLRERYDTLRLYSSHNQQKMDLVVNYLKKLWRVPNQTVRDLVDECLEKLGRSRL